MVGVWGFGCGVWGVGCQVVPSLLGSGIQRGGTPFRRFGVWGVGRGVWGVGFRLRDLRLRV